MKCKECKYYYNGTCSTGVFKDLDNDTVLKIDLGCKYGSLNKQLKKVNDDSTSQDQALNLADVSGAKRKVYDHEWEIVQTAPCGIKWKHTKTGRTEWE